MILVATYAWRYGPPNDEHVRQKGEIFEPTGTITMNREEHAHSLIRQRAARAATPDEISRYRAGRH